MTQSIQPLYAFFAEHLGSNEIRRFFALHYDDLAAHLPEERVANIDLALKAANVLKRNNAIDEALFTQLEHNYPRHRKSIAQLRAQCVAAAGARRLRVVAVAANPAALPELQLAAEARGIQEKLTGTPSGERITFRWVWNAGPNDLLDAFFPDAPDILHFAGHGTRGGILLETRDGLNHPIAPEALARLIGARPNRPRIVVLNACYSVAMASALVSVVDVVVGMHGAVADSAAREFAVQFYRALGHGDAIASAFATAHAALRVHNMLSDDAPQLSVRSGVDPREYRLL